LRRGGRKEGVLVIRGDGCHSFPGNAGYSASINDKHVNLNMHIAYRIKSTEKRYDSA
jgi:hypothetical protein